MSLPVVLAASLWPPAIVVFAALLGGVLRRRRREDTRPAGVCVLCGRPRPLDDLRLVAITGGAALACKQGRGCLS